MYNFYDSEIGLFTVKTVNVIFLSTKDLGWDDPLVIKEKFFKTTNL